MARRDRAGSPTLATRNPRAAPASRSRRRRALPQDVHTPRPGTIEGYAAELERVADYANAGKLGCFVDVRVTDGALQMTLYERWFDGSHIRCDVLTKRSFDPQNGQALIESAEFLGELEYWAERRDERRNLRELEGSIEDAAREDETLNRALAAQELAQILNGHVSPV